MLVYTPDYVKTYTHRQVLSLQSLGLHVSEKWESVYILTVNLLSEGRNKDAKVI